MALPLPGRPCHAVHFVAAPTCAAAPIASHSCGESTPTRLPLTTTCAFGYARLSIFPTETSVEPSVGGRTILACSIPGRWMSATYGVLPVTMPGIAFIGCEVPTTVYWLGGFTGGLPVTVRSESAGGG